MDCWILYDGCDLEANRFFAERLRDRGSELGLGCSIRTTDSVDPEDAPPIVIARTRDYELSGLLEDMGSTVYNRSSVSRICNDKAATLSMADRLGIPILPFSTSGTEGIEGPPWVVKSRIGHGGTEVFEARSELEVSRIMGSMSGRFPMVQRMAPVRGRDLRIYVLGGRTIASVLRTSDEDFRANHGLGGRAELCEPPKAAEDAVKKILPELMPDFVGIDFLFGEDGMVYLNEIEDVVGTRMLYELTDLDPASMYMDYVARHSNMSL